MKTRLAHVLQLLCLVIILLSGAYYYLAQEYMGINRDMIYREYVMFEFLYASINITYTAISFLVFYFILSFHVLNTSFCLQKIIQIIFCVGGIVFAIYMLQEDFESYLQLTLYTLLSGIFFITHKLLNNNKIA